MSSTTGGLPISGLINNPNTTAPPPASNSTMGQADFLKLLTTQLQNQNPLQPMDTTASIAQLAQFTSVQALTSLQASFSSFQSNFSVMQSAGLIGKTVSAATTDATGNSSSVSGTVKTISVINGIPEFTLADSTGKLVTDSKGNPLQLPTSAILSIG